MGPQYEEGENEIIYFISFNHHCHPMRQYFDPHSCHLTANKGL